MTETRSATIAVPSFSPLRLETRSVAFKIGAVLLGYIGAWLAVARHLSELAPR